LGGWEHWEGWNIGGWSIGRVEALGGVGALEGMGESGGREHREGRSMGGGSIGRGGALGGNECSIYSYHYFPHHIYFGEGEHWEGWSILVLF